MQVFFISDTHFCHNNILKYCSARHRFQSIQDHDEYIIERWNENVSDEDVVFHLGDFALGSISRGIEIGKRLKGHIILIAGNHDYRHLKDFTFRERFSKVTRYHEIEIGDTKFILSHYPFQSWNGIRYGTIHLHGHVHGKPVPLQHKNMFDVSVDNHPNFGIWEKNELLKRIKNE